MPPSNRDEPNAEAGGGLRTGSSLVRLDIANTNATLAPPPIGDDVPTVIGANRRSPYEALALPPGFRLGHFEVIGALGSGGMATVLRARDLELGRIVALKILPPESARDPDSVTRFKQEARAAAKLDHDGIARVFFCGEEKGLHFIAFEYVEGETLKTLIDRRGTLPPEDCIRYLIGLAAGLQHASDRGVIHRDVKPSNIVVTPDGKAKLIDMGLARQQGLHSVNGGVTQSGMTLGTFDYISPEQALDPRSVDVRSDIYSLGCAFYHALTGRPPVPEGTAAKKLHAHQHEPPTDPRQLNPLVPDGLAVILSGMMVKIPDRRYASPEALIRDLVALAETLGISIDAQNLPGQSARTGQIRILPSRERNRFSAAALLSFGVVVASIVILVLTLSGRSGHKAVASSAEEPVPTRPGVTVDLIGAEQPRPPVAARRVLQPANAAELIAALGEPNAIIQLAPGQVYDLSATAGATYTGKEFELESQNPAQPAVVKLAASPVDWEKPGAVRAGGLTVSGADGVRIRSVRFAITQKPGGDESTDSPVGLLLDGAAKIELSQCQFELDRSETASDGVGVAVLGANRGGTEIAVRNATVGLRRWVGFELAGAVRADFTECGFATSRSGIRFSGQAATQSLALRFCTFLIENRGAAIEVSDTSSAKIQAGFSLFASANTDPPTMMMPEPNERRPTMIRTAGGATATAAPFANQPSAFYRVESPSGWESPIDLKQHPWAGANPAAKLDSAEPWKAFELDPRLKPIRVQIPRDVQILGVKQLPLDSTKIYGTWPPGGSQAGTLPPGVKVWYPNPPAAEKDSLPDGVYDNLAQAIAVLKPNDTLWIRGAGTVEVPALAAFSKPDFRITIRPEDEKGMVALVPAESKRLDQTMFQLDEGDLRFERIEFRLKPTVERVGDLKSQSAVTVAGGRSCEFHGCIFTMEQRKEEILAAVSLVDASEKMRKTEPVRRPVIRMEDCIVRGRGRAVWAPAAFPFDFTASNVLIALAAPFVELEAPAKPAPSGAVISLQLSHVTAWLAGGLVDLRCGKGTDDKPALFVPVEIRSENCLFVPVGAGAPPMAQVGGGDAALWDRYVTWTASNGNGYGNFPDAAAMVEVTSEEPDGKNKRLDIESWMQFAKEKPASFAKVTFAKGPGSAADLPGVRAEDAAVQDSPFGAGVGCRAKDLPKPGR